MKKSLKQKWYYRRASVYMLVITSSMLLAIMGLGAITATRVARKNLANTTNFTEARFYALSAIEIGMKIISSDSNWRTNYANGTWKSNQTIGNGTYSLIVTDPTDGDIADSQDEAVVITGIGMKGEARHKLSVTMNSDQIGLTCLQTAMHINGNATLTSTTVGQAASTISSNATVTASSATVNSAVEAVTSITGSTYNGTRTSPVTARTMPTSSVYNYYNSNGTVISFSSIPKNNGDATIERVLISPSSNPYGSSLNANGIYIINCGGQRIIIQNCRIFGTLYIINPTSDSSIQGSVLMESATGNLPCLLVNGPMRINITNSSLNETAFGPNVNFNPAGVPYNGSTDSDVSDSYPSIIRGLIYVSGALTTSNYVTVNGVLVGGSTLSSTGTLDLTYDSRFYNTPPPGFDNPPQLSIIQGSWAQSVN